MKKHISHGYEGGMRNNIGIYDYYAETIKQMAGNGLLLVSGEKGNPMTIGWGTIGIIWGIPVFCVLVRPSRYSFGLLEEHPEFTVNVPVAQLQKQVFVCGTKSGRDVDKVKKCGFTLAVSKDISVPYIKECPVHYECRIIHKNKVSENTLDPGLDSSFYPDRDVHTVYFGKILGAYSEK
jgi:flavin reductase (DIM6/NTAB) family NADH-FMN oxidoreductase RutF